MDGETRSKLRRVHRAMADIDGLSFRERLAAVERGLFGESDVALWESLADLRRRHTRHGAFSESKKMALATLLLMTMDSAVSRIGQARHGPSAEADGATPDPQD